MKLMCAFATLGFALVISQGASADDKQSFCDKHSGKFTIKLSSCSVDANTGNSPTAPAGGGTGPSRGPGGTNPGNFNGSKGDPTPG